MSSEDLLALWALVGTCGGVLALAAMRLWRRRVIADRMFAYSKACRSLTAARTADGYSGVDEATRRRIEIAGIQLVLVIDVLYALGDRRAAQWAVCLDEFPGLLLSDFALEDLASDPETSVAIAEARAAARARTQVARPLDVVERASPGSDAIADKAELAQAAAFVKE